MKKLLVLLLVLGMASMANAYIIEVVTNGLGDLGHSGTINDRLEPSETIPIKIVLNYNPHYYYPGYVSYDGYMLSMMDLDLHVSGNGSFDAITKLDGTIKKRHVNFDPWGNSPVTDTGVDQMGGIAGTAIGPGPQDLVWDMFIHCDGPGPIVVDLTLNGLSEYSPYNYPRDWVALSEGDLGDLVIYNVPEPMTIALLGLGGLFLRRRK
jgi:hypothetical protein